VKLGKFINLLIYFSNGEMNLVPNNVNVNLISNGGYNLNTDKNNNNYNSQVNNTDKRTELKQIESMSSLYKDNTGNVMNNNFSIKVKLF
jgi:hypothetical protein